MKILDRILGPGGRDGIRFAAHVLREQRAIQRAAKRMPKPVPWEWAKPRLVPMLSGPCIDPPGSPIVRTTAGPGCAVEFGLEIGGVFLVVDAPVAERWECTPAQLLAASLDNLRKRTSRLSALDISTGVFSGRMTRMIRQPGWAASLVLLEDELLRLLGTQEQFIAVPSRAVLISFPITTPMRILADTIVDLEASEPLPLMYEPFLVQGGRLLWQSQGDPDSGDAGW